MKILSLIALLTLVGSTSAFCRDALTVHLVAITAEEVKLEVVNEESTSVIFQFVGVEKLTEETWAPVRGTVTCPCQARCAKRIFTLQPDQSRSFTWDRKNNTCGQMTGTFRFVIPKYRDQDVVLAAGEPFRLPHIPADSFGAVLGRPIIRAQPEPGKYAGRYYFSIDKIWQREISLHRTIQGDAHVELSADQSVAACFTIRWEESSSRGRFITRDRKTHYSTKKEDIVLRADGHWSRESENTLRVKLGKGRLHSCEDLTADNSEDIDIGLTLKCLSPSCERTPQQFFLC